MIARPAHSLPWMQPTTSTLRRADGRPYSHATIGRPRTEWPMTIRLGWVLGAAGASVTGAVVATSTIAEIAASVAGCRSRMSTGEIPDSHCVEPSRTAVASWHALGGLPAPAARVVRRVADDRGLRR